MGGQGNAGKLIVYCFILLLLFLGLVSIVFSVTGGRFFYVELAFAAALLMASLFGLVVYSRRQNQDYLFFVFLAYLLNVIILWVVEGSLFITISFLSVLGFVLSLPQWKNNKKQQTSTDEPHSVVFEPAAEKATKTFSPGKYVASARANYFHAPKCEWAKKIAEERRVWFREREEAAQKGYTAHSCVQ